MAFVTKTVNIGTDWTLITSRTALLQFNDEMYMMITGDNTPPTEVVGFIIEKLGFYSNSALNTYVWAKSRLGGTNIESVRVVEDI